VHARVEGRRARRPHKGNASHHGQVEASDAQGDSGVIPICPCDSPFLLSFSPYNLFCFVLFFFSFVILHAQTTSPPHLQPIEHRLALHENSESVSWQQQLDARSRESARRRRKRVQRLLFVRDRGLFGFM